MKTLGIGVDIIHNKRINALIKKKILSIVRTVLMKLYILKKFWIKLIILPKDLQQKNH